jgi:hypothetical protein
MYLAASPGSRVLGTMPGIEDELEKYCECTKE